MFHRVSEYFPLQEVTCAYPELPLALWVIPLLGLFAVFVGKIRRSCWLPTWRGHTMEGIQNPVLQLPGRKLILLWSHARQVEPSVLSLPFLQPSHLCSNRTVYPEPTGPHARGFFWPPRRTRFLLAAVPVVLLGTWGTLSSPHWWPLALLTGHPGHEALPHSSSGPALSTPWSAPSPPWPCASPWP